MRRSLVAAAVTLVSTACSAVWATQSAAAPGGHLSGDFEENIHAGGGYQLFLRCTGHGSPTVILEAALGNTSDTWASVEPEVARFTRVCSYDRASVGRSDPAPRPRTSQSSVDDLRALLGLAGVGGPYVLVAHSFGGYHTQLFARQDQVQERQVAGAVLVDATPVDWPSVLDRFGVPTPTPEQNPEGVDVRASAEEIGWAPPFPDVPLVVLTRTAGSPNADVEHAWQQRQQAHAGLSRQGELVVAEGAGHFIQRDRPDVVVDAIRRVVGRATLGGDKPVVGTFTEFPVPTPDSSPPAITTGPDGNLWFTQGLGNKIGRLTTDGEFTEFPVPTAASEPSDITPGPDGALWFTEFRGNRIGRITTDGSITEFPLPADEMFFDIFTQSLTSSRGPRGIVAGPDGNLWFAEFNAARIGRMTTTGELTEYRLPTPNTRVVRITAGPDGALWFAEPGASKIGRITTDGVITEFATPTPASRPVGIASGPDGNLWFTEVLGNRIGRITPEGVITEFPLPTGGPGEQATARPEDITAGPDGALWFTEFNADQIGRITTAGVITEYPIPTPESRPHGIAAGPDGGVWFTASQANRIGRIQAL